jgi:hypothetical protein
MIPSRIGHFPHDTAGVDSEMYEQEGRRLCSRGRRGARADELHLASRGRRLIRFLT